MRRCILFALLFIFNPGMSSLFALDLGKAITQYVHNHWTKDQGLPVNRILSLAQTKDGYLWVGTVEGLVRFDGMRFEVFDKVTTKEIQSNVIYQLLTAHDGSLWIGTTGGGITHYKNGIFTAYDNRKGLSNGIIYSLYEDRHGNIWAGTRDGGLNLFVNGRFKSYGVKEGLFSNTVQTMLQDTHGYLWIGTDNGLCRLFNHRIQCYTTQNGLSHPVIASLLEDDSGQIWIGTIGGGITIYADEKFQKEPSLRPFSDTSVVSLIKDHQGAIWIGSHRGVGRWKNGKLTLYSTEQGLDDNRVIRLYEDRKSNLWAATVNGLTRIDGAGLSSVSSLNDFSLDRILAMLEDHEGNLWLGAGSGLSKLSEGKFFTYTTLEGLSTDQVGPIHQNNDGDLWIGTLQGGVNLFNNGKISLPFGNQSDLQKAFHTAIWRDSKRNLWIGTGEGLFRIRDGITHRYGKKDGLPDVSVRVIYEDRTGTIWVGTEGGLAKWSESKFIPYTLSDGLSDLHIRFIYQDRKGNLWVGTPGGLNQWKNGNFFVYGTEHGLSNEMVQAIHEDRTGVLWIGTLEGGLNRFQNGRFTHFTIKQGLPDDDIFQILEDNHENLWMSSHKGIFRVSKRQLEDLSNGKIRSVHVDFFDQSDGMRSSEGLPYVHPSGWKTIDGNLWFPTAKGLVRINPDRIPVNHIAPNVVIEKVVIDDERFLNSKSDLLLKPGKKKFEFHYTALSFVAPQKVRFRYFLEGFDNNWVDAGTRRVAYYTNIPPGNYSFRIIACNNDGIWNKTGSTVSFTLQPQFFQTRWFLLCCVLATISIAFGLHSLRLKKIKDRMEAVMAERARISREIHDTLAQKLTAVSLQLKSAENSLLQEPNSAQEHLSLARDLIRSSQKEARRFLHDLRPDLLQQSDLPTALKQTAAEITSDSLIQLSFQANGRIRSLPEIIENNLLRIAQEALTNCLRHANATRIEMDLSYDSDSVSLSVKDNGSGFGDTNNVKKDHSHFGLKSMSERVEQLKGSLKIDSKPGEGTIVAVTIPLSTKIDHIG